MSHHFKKFITVIILPLLINCINKEKKELSGTLQVKGAILHYPFEGSGLPCVVFAGSENIAMTQKRRFAPVNGYLNLLFLALRLIFEQDSYIPFQKLATQTFLPSF
jgi:hypothetical protein